MEEFDRHWLERAQVVGKAQARYLWVLLVTMLFFAALQDRDATKPTDAPSVVPVVGLPLNRAVVMASGPAVISFLALAVLGTMRAYRRAREGLKLSAGADWSGEEIDTSPNAIDLAFDSRPESSGALKVTGHLAYPTFLLMALVEAAWLWRDLLTFGQRGPVWSFLVSIGALLWLRAVWLLILVYYQRLQEIPGVLKRKGLDTKRTR